MGKVRFNERELTQLQETWLRRFHAEQKDERQDQLVRWVNSVLDVMERRGDEIISAHVRIEEERLLSGPLKQDYIEALMSVVGDVAGLILATDKQRAKALLIVKANTSEPLTAQLELF